jgi:FMN phosphatase YigB (HAD superfamily)
MYKKTYTLTAALCFFSAIFTQNLRAEHIIFDLGGVLLKTNELFMAKKTGFFTLSLYALSHFENPRTEFFELLRTIPPFTQTTIPVYDEKNNPLPPIICDWLKGIPTKKILPRLKTTMGKKHPLWPLTKAIFDPETLGASQRIISAGAQFVQECIANGHSVYILSNWDSESFTYVQEKFPEFFSLFSGIVISGDCGLVKPDPAIFRYLLEKFDLDAEECFFVDNQQENVTAAHTIGIKGVTVKTNWLGTPNFKKVNKALQTWLKEKPDLSRAPLV